MRPLHESMAKEKWSEILLIEAENEANNELLASFSTKSSEILVIFTRHLIRAKVSTYTFRLLKAFDAASSVSLISFSVCALERNPASYADGAKLTPESNIW